MLTEHNDGKVTTIERGDYGTIIREVYGEYDYTTLLGSIDALDKLARLLDWRVDYFDDSTCVSVYQNNGNAFCLCSDDTPTIQNVQHCIQWIQQVENHYPEG